MEDLRCCGNCLHADITFQYAYCDNEESPHHETAILGNGCCPCWVQDNINAIERRAFTTWEVW